MKRWQKLSAALESAPAIQMAMGKGVIGASPAWVDTLDAPDYYAKLVRKGLVRVHAEADDLTSVDGDGARASSPSPAARLIQATEDLEAVQKRIEKLKAEDKKAPRDQEELEVCERTKRQLEQELKALEKTLKPAKSGSKED